MCAFSCHTSSPQRALSGPLAEHCAVMGGGRTARQARSAKIGIYVPRLLQLELLHHVHDLLAQVKKFINAAALMALGLLTGKAGGFDAEVSPSSSFHSCTLKPVTLLTPCAVCLQGVL
eukprot:scaffold10289_cov17-Tisochrysis_lutea.AAC.1